MGGASCILVHIDTGGFLWTWSISPFLQAAESIKNATAAEEKLQEVEQRFSKIETELLGKQKKRE